MPIYLALAAREVKVHVAGYFALTHSTESL